MEEPWNVHPRKLDREIFEDGPSAKIGSLENFRPYGISNIYMCTGIIESVDSISRDGPDMPYM